MIKINDPTLIAELLRKEEGMLHEQLGQPFVDLLKKLESAIAKGNDHEALLLSQKLYEFIMNGDNKKLCDWLNERLEANLQDSTSLDLEDIQFPSTDATKGLIFEGDISGSSLDVEITQADAQHDDSEYQSGSTSADVELLMEQPATSAIKESKFLFELKGNENEVFGNSVLANAVVDLVFKLAIPGDKDLAVLSGECLDELKQEGTKVGLMIVPLGYQLVENNIVYKWGTIQSGTLAPELQFRLSAWNSRKKDAGVFVWLFREEEEGGKILLYNFFLSIPVVTSIPDNLGVTSPIQVNLDTSGKPLDAILILEEQADHTITASFSIKGISTDNNRSISLKKLSAGTISTILETLKNETAEVPANKAWSNLEDPFSVKLETHVESENSDRSSKARKKAVRSLAEAGYHLWSGLNVDPDFQKIMQQLNTLPEGSRIKIQTNSLFLPWEVIYPEPYDKGAHKDATAPVKNKLFWGTRFIIETTLLSDDTHNPEAEKKDHQTNTVETAVYACINIAMDNDFKDSNLKPARSHQEWFEDWSNKSAIKVVIKIDGQASRKVFTEEPLSTHWIYLYSHGQGGENAELAVSNMDDERIQPADMLETPQYSGRPIVFLNTCSSGSYGSLSPLKFYPVLREKRALGLIATSFSVPTIVAAAISKRVTRDYFEGKEDIGCILLKMRRDLMNNQVPIGLFYTLHCTGDITASALNKSSECPFKYKEI